MTSMYYLTENEAYGIVHPKIEILSSFICPHAIPNMYGLLFIFRAQRSYVLKDVLTAWSIQ